MRQDELTLDEMLADPIVQLLMKRDGVDETDVRRLMDRLQVSSIKLWDRDETGIGRAA